MSQKNDKRMRRVIRKQVVSSTQKIQAEAILKLYEYQRSARFRDRLVLAWKILFGVKK